MKFVMVDIDDSKTGLWLVYDIMPVFIKWIDADSRKMELAYLTDDLGMKVACHGVSDFSRWEKIINDAQREKSGGNAEANPNPYSPNEYINVIGGKAGYWQGDDYIVMNDHVTPSLDPEYPLNYNAHGLSSRPDLGQ